MDEKIVKFLKKMHLLTLGVINENKPYLCSAFYAYDEENYKFIIASDANTTHIKATHLNQNVSICIALDTKIIGKIQGIQSQGIIKKATKNSKEIYYKNFPYALAYPSDMFEIDIKWIKFTDNTLGFGKKLIWKSI